MPRRSTCRIEGLRNDRTIEPGQVREHWIRSLRNRDQQLRRGRGSRPAPTRPASTATEKTAWKFTRTDYPDAEALASHAAALGIAVAPLPSAVALALANLWLRPSGPQGGLWLRKLVDVVEPNGFRALALL